MILNFIISIFGQLLQLSIAKKWEHHLKVGHVQIAFGIYWIVIFLTVNLSTTYFLLVQFISLATLPIVKTISFQQKKNWLKLNVQAIVESLLIDVKTGASLPQAIKNISTSAPTYLVIQIEKFLLKRSLSQKIDRTFMFYSFFRKLEIIEGSGGRTIEQLESWRNQIKVNQSLERKKNTGLSQVRAQMLVFIVLICVLSVFFWTSSPNPNSKIYVMSIIWSAFGAIVLQKMGQLPMSMHLKVLQIIQDCRSEAIMGLSIKNSLLKCRENSEYDTSQKQFIESVFSAKPPIYDDSLTVHVDRVLRRGLVGEPVLSALNHLETELCEKGLTQIEIKLNKLPVYGLIPLFLFFLPSCFVLIMAPLLNSALIN